MSAPLSSSVMVSQVVAQLLALGSIAVIVQEQQGTNIKSGV